jgi:hypothetical protein
MNTLKKTRLAVLLAIAACGASAPAFAKDDACKSFIADHRTQIEKALIDHFGGSDHQVGLGRNDGDYDFLRLRNQPGTIVEITNCSVRYSVLAQKYSPPVENTGGNPPKRARSQDGRVIWRINFDPAQVEKMCIKGHHMTEVNWKNDGRLTEKVFVRANGDKKSFEGCLLG